MTFERGKTNTHASVAVARPTVEVCGHVRDMLTRASNSKGRDPRVISEVGPLRHNDADSSGNAQ